MNSVVDDRDGSMPKDALLTLSRMACLLFSISSSTESESCIALQLANDSRFDAIPERERRAIFRRYIAQLSKQAAESDLHTLASHLGNNYSSIAHHLPSETRTPIC